MSPTLIPAKRLPGLVKTPVELTKFASVIPLIFFLVKTVTIPQEILFISLVPGGVTEMSLLAVVLSSDATFVTIHHIWRILVVVIEILVLTRLNLFKSG